MAANLVSLVMQFLTPDVVGRIAAALGIDRNAAQTGVNTAVPSLLAGFASAAAQPAGAQQLVDAAMQQAGVLGNFESTLSGAGRSSYIESGSQMLSSLLGSRDQNALAGAIAKFAGIGQNATGSLLGMLAPVVLGTITQHIGASRLDPGRIANLLASQRDNISAALPSGFGNLLAGTRLMDSLGGAAQTATAAGREAASASAAAARTVGDTTGRLAGRAPASTNWLYWFIPAAAVAALAIYFLARPAEQVAEQEGVTVGQSVTVSSLNNVDKQATDTIDSLRGTLGGITDAASAQAALPKLRDAATRIDQINGLSGGLSAEQRRQLAASVNPMMPALNQLFDKALAIPDASEELKPIVDTLRAKLATLAA